VRKSEKEAESKGGELFASDPGVGKSRNLIL